MKCKFCGENNETVAMRSNELELCDTCESMRPVEMPIEATEQTMEAPSDVKTEIVIGVRTNGSLYFSAAGSDINLLAIDGLLKFAERRMKKIWEQRDVEVQASIGEDK